MQKSFWKKVSDWFTVSRVLITFWNVIAFCYHFFYIGIGSWASIIIQISAILTEYLVSGPYEQLLLWSNIVINTKTLKLSSWRKTTVKIVSKYLIFAVIFGIIYGTTYYIRLEFFHLVNWGVDFRQLNKSMINMGWFTLVAGPLMGVVVLKRKEKRRKIQMRKQYQNRIKYGSVN